MKKKVKFSKGINGKNFHDSFAIVSKCDKEEFPLLPRNSMEVP